MNRKHKVTARKQFRLWWAACTCGKLFRVTRERNKAIRLAVSHARKVIRKRGDK